MLLSTPAVENLLRRGTLWRRKYCVSALSELSVIFCPPRRPSAHPAEAWGRSNGASSMPSEPQCPQSTRWSFGTPQPCLVCTDRPFSEKSGAESFCPCPRSSRAGHTVVATCEAPLTFPDHECACPAQGTDTASYEHCCCEALCEVWSYRVCVPGCLPFHACACPTKSTGAAPRTSRTWRYVPSRSGIMFLDGVVHIIRANVVPHLIDTIMSQSCCLKNVINMLRTVVDPAARTLRL